MRNLEKMRILEKCYFGPPAWSKIRSAPPALRGGLSGGAPRISILFVFQNDFGYVSVLRGGFVLG